jgi:hypothetical protein
MDDVKTSLPRISKARQYSLPIACRGIFSLQARAVMQRELLAKASLPAGRLHRAIWTIQKAGKNRANNVARYLVLAFCSVLS